jgi:hypothetical protein
VSNVVKTKVVHDQRIPIGLLKLSRQMTGHVVVDLSEILQEKKTRYLALKCSTTMPCQRCELVCQQQPDEQYTCVRVCLLTETKKLLVPSLRPKKSPGNSFSHVSSP